MKKRILSLFLLVAMLISMNVSMPSSKAVSATTLEEENKEVEYIEKENIVIEGHSYEYIQYCRDKQKKTIRIMSLKTKEDILIIPAKINGEAVLEVGGTYFEFKTREDSMVEEGFEVEKVLAWQINKEQKLKKIVVSEGIEKIIPMGFKNTEAECIEFPKSLKIIGEKNAGGACFSNSKIEHVIVKGKKTTIGSNAFLYSGLKQISLPKNFQGKICSSAFEESKLERFVWPTYKNNATEKVGSCIFQNCRNLKEVVFPKNQKHIYIPEACFYGCTKLKKLAFPASTKKVTYNWNPYADNYKMGARTLVFKGKKTKIVGIVRNSKKNKNVLTVGKIIAPKGSKALAYAKKAKRVKWLAKWVQRDIRAYSGPTVNYTDGYDGRAIKYAKMKYSVLKKK